MKTGPSYSEIADKFKLILREESSLFIIAIIYGIGASIFTLAVPLSVQLLVNTVTMGVLYQPLVILTLLLFLLLMFSGALNAMQIYTMEIVQRHFYAKLSANISARLLNAKTYDLRKKNGAELVNRYFDISTAQKLIATLVTDGAAVILQTLVGMTLLALYHPYFIVFDALLILLLWLTWALFGKKAMVTASLESGAKYKAASWFEEIAEHNIFFKTHRKKAAAIEKADGFIANYLDKRRDHFRRLFSQTILLLAIYAFMSSLVLGLGGFLVIKGQLTLGQLVAAELVISIILVSLSKSGKHLESFYNLFAAVEKLSQFYEVELEDIKQPLPLSSNSFSLRFENVLIKQGSDEYFYDLRFEQGCMYCVSFESYAGKFIFLELLQAQCEATKGRVTLAGQNLIDLSPLDIRDNIQVVHWPVIIEGTIRDNLRFGNKDVADSLIKEVCQLLDLDPSDELTRAGNTILERHGLNKPQLSHLIRIEIGRAILSQSKILIFTQAFNEVDEVRRMKVYKYLKNKSDITAIFLDEKHHPKEMFDKCYTINKGGSSGTDNE